MKWACIAFLFAGIMACSSISQTTRQQRYDNKGAEKIDATLNSDVSLQSTPPLVVNLTQSASGNSVITPNIPDFPELLASLPRHEQQLVQERYLENSSSWSGSVRAYLSQVGGGYWLSLGFFMLVLVFVSWWFLGRVKFSLSRSGGLRALGSVERLLEAMLTRCEPQGTEYRAYMNFRSELARQMGKLYEMRRTN
jgi:hypothetical protein